MKDVGGQSDVKDVNESFSEVEGFKNIKPEEGMTIDKAMDYVEKLFAKEIKNLVDETGKNSETDSKDSQETKEGEKPYSELTDEERAKIKEETGWSDEIIDHIKNMEQYEIYKNADLVEGEINGRKCLLKRNLDMDYVSEKTIDEKHPNGVSNRDLMKEGKSPYDPKNGEKIELHHMGQSYDSPFAELCENSEHSDGNHSVLHDSEGESWRRDPDLKKQYNNYDKPNHWKERGEE